MVERTKTNKNNNLKNDMKKHNNIVNSKTVF